MSKFRLAHLGLVMAAIGFNAAVPMVGLSSIAHAQSVRAEVGKPLQEAQKLAASGRNKEALAKLKEADAVGGKSELEKFQLEYTRGSIAAAAGENDTAARAFESVLASGKLNANQQSKITEALASIYLRARDYPKAITYIQKVLKDNPGNSQMREQLIQTYYLSGKLNEAARELNSGAKSEANLQMLANIQLKQNDKAGYVNTLEKLAANYPKASYWADLLNRVVGKPGFSGSLNLDVLRLKLALKQITKPAEFMEMGQLALQAGNPAEALKIVDEGYKKGALGTGADAGRHQRLKDLAVKTLAEQQTKAGAQEANFRKEKDADGLANLGFAMVSDGKPDGLKLIDEAIKLGTARKPEEMKLHYGIAQYNAGKKANALSTLKSVKGTAGEPELARYWTMYINNPV